MELVLYPDPILKRRTENVLEIDADLEEKVEEMIALMHEADGVGLAAPQVGWNARLFVCNPTGEEGDDWVFINPEVVESFGRETREEGCLSLPGVIGKILRPERVRIRAYDLEGEEVEMELDGLFARVFQHENDHLEGILITDRMSPAERRGIRRELRALEKRYEEKKASSLSQ